LPATSQPEEGRIVLNLSAKAPPGISIILPNKPVSVFLTGGLIPNSVTFTLVADKNVAPGDYKVSVVGTSGSSTYNLSFTVRVVSYLVTMSNDAYTPSNLTVKAGSTVYWINADPTPGDREIHDVRSRSGPLHSPALYPNPIFESWSYTFTTPGRYDYIDSYSDGLMSGTVIVTA
jgi:plastocyanin